MYFRIAEISTCFFCKQKTGYEMLISDWSSDVCSSDLRLPHDGLDPRAGVGHVARVLAGHDLLRLQRGHAEHGGRGHERGQVGRAEERRVGKEGVGTWRLRW